MKKVFAILDLLLHIFWFGVIVFLFVALSENQVFASSMIDIYENITQTAGHTIEGFYEEFVDLLLFVSFICGLFSAAFWITLAVFRSKDYRKALRGERPRSRKHRMHLEHVSDSSTAVISGTAADSLMKKRAKEARRKEIAEKRAKEREARIAAREAYLRIKHGKTAEETLNETKKEVPVVKKVETTVKVIEPVKTEEVKQEEVKAEPVVQQTVTQPAVKAPAQQVTQSIPAQSVNKPRYSGNSQLDAILQQAMARRGRR